MPKPMLPFQALCRRSYCLTFGVFRGPLAPPRFSSSSCSTRGSGAGPLPGGHRGGSWHPHRALPVPGMCPDHTDRPGCGTQPVLFLHPEASPRGTNPTWCDISSPNPLGGPEGVTKRLCGHQVPIAGGHRTDAKAPLGAKTLLALQVAQGMATNPSPAPCPRGSVCLGSAPEPH